MRIVQRSSLLLDCYIATVVAHRYSARQSAHFLPAAIQRSPSTVVSTVPRRSFFTETREEVRGDGGKSTHPSSMDLGLGFVKVWPGYGQGRAGYGMWDTGYGMWTDGEIGS
jgi:hypothetical protein